MILPNLQALKILSDINIDMQGVQSGFYSVFQQGAVPNIEVNKAFACLNIDNQFTQQFGSQIFSYPDQSSEDFIQRCLFLFQVLESFNSDAQALNNLINDSSEQALILKNSINTLMNDCQALKAFVPLQKSEASQLNDNR